MPIDFTCPHCQHQMKVAEQFAGQTGPCSQCGEQITIPGVFLPASDSATENPYAGPVVESVSKEDSDKAALRLLLPVDRSAWAIAAGYLGLLSILCIPAPFAIITGAMAIREIKSNPDLHGLGRAWFGIVMGTLGTLLLCVSIVGMAFG